MSELAIELQGIDKSFGLVHANRNINLKVRKGTIHGIIGENGAGKSTLMSILYGFYQADHGDILVGGRKVSIRDPNAAIAAGIGMVHQHFMLVEPLSDSLHPWTDAALVQASLEEHTAALIGAADAAARLLPDEPAAHTQPLN